MAIRRLTGSQQEGRQAIQTRIEAHHHRVPLALDGLTQAISKMSRLRHHSSMAASGTTVMPVILTRVWTSAYVGDQERRTCILIELRDFDGAQNSPPVDGEKLSATP
jgi:hypothetical protein